jgi:hypothetical protein
LQCSFGEAEAMSAARLDGIVRALGRTLTIADAPTTDEGLAAFLDRVELDPRDRASLLALGPKRLSVYRSLVRGTLTSAVKKQLALTAGVFGDRFDEELATFFAAGMPKSHYLFDVPFELFDASSARWAADRTLPPFVCDLARFELTDFAVAALRPSDPGDVVEELALDAPLVFSGAHRLVRYDFAVHTFAPGDALEPAVTWLLTYRDNEDDIAHLELSPPAAFVFDRLVGGATVRGALEAAAAAGTPLPIDQASQLFADLAARGVLLGRRSS